MSDSCVVATLSDLVRINSVNPAYQGGVGEAGVAAYVREFFQEAGIEVWEQEVFPGRNNVIACLPGRDRGRRILLEAHMDTVSVEGMTIPPFEPRTAAGRIHGRGACDTKAGLAAMMHAVLALHTDRVVPSGDVWLAAVVDEEFSYRGVVKLCEGLTADAAIVAEPTELKLVVASKGVLRWRIVVRGRAAHSSKPHLGANAIEHMARVVMAIESNHAGLAMKSHRLLGSATCNVGVIRGGVQVNIVPERCEIEVDRRLLPGESVGRVLADYQAMLDRLSVAHPGFEASMEPPMLVDEALDTPEDAPPVRVGRLVLSELGLDDCPAGVPFGCDASKLSRQGVPSVVFGPGSIDRAHSADEYVEIDQLHAALEFYRRFLTRFE